MNLSWIVVLNSLIDFPRQWGLVLTKEPLPSGDDDQYSERGAFGRHVEGLVQGHGWILDHCYYTRITFPAREEESSVACWWDREAVSQRW